MINKCPQLEDQLKMNHAKLLTDMQRNYKNIGPFCRT